MTQSNSSKNQKDVMLTVSNRNLTFLIKQINGGSCYSYLFFFFFSIKQLIRWFKFPVYRNSKLALGVFHDQARKGIVFVLKMRVKKTEMIFPSRNKSHRFQ